MDTIKNENSKAAGIDKMKKIDFDDFQDEEGAGGQGHQGS
jgi:hypothetical protein